MAIAAAVRAIRKRLKREQAPVEDTELTQRQSWRRLAGGARPDWKSLQAMPFNDGQEFFRLRLEAWLQARRCNPITKRITWQWVSVEASGFKICAGSVRRDPIAEEICMEDVLGVMCTHQISAENKDSEIDSPHERAAYFRRTNLHDSEDASDIQSLVAQVEAEYLVQHGQVPQATGSNPAGLDVELATIAHLVSSPGVDDPEASIAHPPSPLPVRLVRILRIGLIMERVACEVVDAVPTGRRG